MHSFCLATWPEAITFDKLRTGFKPIWPISSNWDPRSRWPHAPPTTNANLHFLSKLLVYNAGAGPSFFMSVWETKTFIKFFQRSRKIQYTLALIPPSIYTKTLFYKDLGIQMIQLRSLKSLQRARSKLKKTLERPTVFCKHGLRCQLKSKWTARF